MSRGLSFQQLMAALLFCAIAVTACLMPAQSDTYWHLRAGQEIWQTLRVPLDEHYSFTAAGRAWPNHEWVWQVISYGLYRLGGMPLLLAAGAAMVVGAFVLEYRLMVGAAMVRFWLVVAGLPFSAWIWSLRPQIASLLLLAVLGWLLVHERYRWLPPLFVLWANLHGAVGLGGLALGAVTVAAALRARGGAPADRRRLRTLALLLPVCAALTALTPMGFGLWRFIAESMERSRQTRIIEWMPTWPTHPLEIGFWVLAATFLTLIFIRFFVRRRALAAAPWGDLVLLAMALAILPLAFRAVRNTSPFALIAVPAASRLLRRRDAVAAVTAAAVADVADVDRPRLNLAIVAVAGVLAAATVVFTWTTRTPRLGWDPLPAGALAAARACPGPLYNRYNEGGFLIWFAPERRVFIDSRQDPYPLPFLLESIRAEQGGAYRPLFARHGIRCALLPVEAALTGVLARDGWPTRYRDARWSVFGSPPAGRAGP